MDADGFQQVKLTKKQRWKKEKQIRDQIVSQDIMSVTEASVLERRTRQGFDVTKDLDVTNRCDLSEHGEALSFFSYTLSHSFLFILHDKTWLNSFV